MNLNSIVLDFIFMFSGCYLLFLLNTTIISLLISILLNSFNISYSELPVLELIWTIFPGIILLLVAIPSVELLYVLEMGSNPILKFSVTGHQWYWSYCIGGVLNFDSYLESQSLESVRTMWVYRKVRSVFSQKWSLNYIILPPYLGTKKSNPWSH